MKVHIELDNPYTKYIDIEAVPQNDEVKSGSLAYKANRRSLDKILEILAGMCEFVHNSTEETTGSTVGQENAGSEITGEESEQEIIEKYNNI